MPTQNNSSTLSSLKPIRDSLQQPLYPRPVHDLHQNPVKKGDKISAVCTDETGKDTAEFIQML
jgi:hypothetical protein